MTKNDGPEHYVTGLLAELRDGKREALDQLLPLVYEELKRIAAAHMRSERRDHTLQTTALVHEACLRLAGADVAWKDRVHFYAVASRMMRRVLVDHARAQRSVKRGGGEAKVPLDEALTVAFDRPWDLLDLDRALERLSRQDEQKARVVELKFFGGMTVDEIAAVLDRTADSVAWDLRMAKAYLRRELDPAGDS